MLSGATCLVSNGNNISSRVPPTMKARQILKRVKRPRPVLVSCLARFAAYDVKGRQVATGNGASCPWQQYHFNVKTWWPNFVAPYSTDNRSIIFFRLIGVEYQLGHCPVFCSSCWCYFFFSFLLIFNHYCANNKSYKVKVKPLKIKLWCTNHNRDPSFFFYAPANDCFSQVFLSWPSLGWNGPFHLPVKIISKNPSKYL